MVLLSPTPPSRLMLSLVPLLLFIISLELLHLAITLCLPFLSVALTTFQLFLRLLHHCEGITAHQAGAFPFNSTGILIAPNIPTLDFNKH